MIYCCFKECNKEAYWEIAEDGKHPADAITHACMDHVGHLMGDNYHTVYPISFTNKREVTEK